MPLRASGNEKNTPLPTKERAFADGRPLNFKVLPRCRIVRERGRRQDIRSRPCVSRLHGRTKKW